ncbi:MAG: CHASE domain-containing protein [Anaeromyxobacter sp.]
MRRRTPALPRLRRHAAAAVVAAVGVACSAAAYRLVRESLAERQEQRVREVVATRTAALRDRLDAYAALLRAGAGLLQVLGRDPTVEEFRSFVEALDLPAHAPGLQGLGWTKLLQASQVEVHEAEQRSLGWSTYRVWPRGDRPQYTAIDALEPLDWRNRRAIGYDMYSEPVRRAAMDRAAESGEVAATGKVELVQEAGEQRQAGFLMYFAVYRDAQRAAPDQERVVRGWLYAPFRVHDLVLAVLGPPDPAIRLELYDGPAPLPEDQLIATGPQVARPLFLRDATLDVGGRPWLVHFLVSPDFASRGETALPPAALAAGLLLTLLVTWVTAGEANARRRAERASRRTSFLAEAGKLLASSLDYRRTLEEVIHLAAERLDVASAACLLEAEGERWVAAQGDPAQARRLLEALVAEGLDPESRAGIAAALRVRGTVALDGVAAAPEAQARTPGLAAALRELEVHAALHVPLLARGERLGGISLLACRGRAAFDCHDVTLAEDLGRLAAAAVDTARLYRDAQDAIRARDEFLSIASHELKTPLTSLALQSDSLRAVARRSKDQGLAGKAEVVRRNVERLVRLVASLLDISRITAGRLELELEDVDLAAVAREVAHRFEEEAQRAGCALGLELDGHVVGRWDRLRVDQVVTNLLSNAIKYGQGQPIDVRVSAQADRAVLAVRDHGIGIAPADQPRIFERFERAVSKRNYGGFGLGLWIVRQLVEAMGGTVRVESAPGQGALFTVELVRTPTPLRPPAPATGDAREHA